MQINNDDLRMFKAFKTVIDKGKYEIQGSAAKAVGSLFVWFENLEKRMEDSLSAKPIEAIKPKEKKEVIKKL